MRNLKLSEIAQIAEIVAAVAVVVSLLYVARGLNENTAAIRAQSAQEVTAGTRESLMAIALDEQLSEIMRRGSFDISELTPQEAYRYGLFSRQRWLFLQGVWIQNELGVMNEKAWLAYERIICSIIDNEAGDRVEWQKHVGILDPEFIAFVESCGA